MRTPVRVGTVASTFLLLILLWTIFHHSEYLRDRWDRLDDLKGDIADGLKAQLGSSGAKTTSIDPKYVGFGIPISTAARPLEALEAAATPTTTPQITEVAASSEQTEGPEDGAVEVDDAEDGGILETLPDKIVVMGKKTKDDTTWVQEYLSDWQSAIYFVDDENATLHTPMNKGREAMAYLTYIIENYGNYPSTVAFVHNHKDRFWHADGMPARSNMIALRALNIDFVQEEGFANLRCSLGPGCPAELLPYREDTPENRMYEKNMTGVWESFFGTRCPEVIAAPCCAQFAVSRDQIMARPIEDYVRYRRWLMDTSMEDENSGRVFEYLWHIIFGREAVHCPDYGSCWANVYGGKTREDLHRLMVGIGR